MSSLYDSYQLANSRAVKPFVGSTINELTRVADVMQNRYDTSQAGMEHIQELEKATPVLDQDKQLYNQRLQSYNKQLSDWSSRPDLENVTRDVIRSARNFASEAGAFAQNHQAAQAYQTELDKQVDKGDISKERADMLKAFSHDQYRGMQYDPDTGRYAGQFQGLQAAKEVDLSKWVHEQASNIAAQRGGVLVEQPNGDYFIKRGNEWEKITPEQISQALEAGLRNDNRLSSDINQRALLSSWRAAKTTRLSDYAQSPAAQQAMQQLISKGVPEQQAIAAVVHDSSINALHQNLMDIGRKYAFDRQKSSYEYGPLTLEGELAKKRKLESDSFLAVPTIQPGQGKPIQTVGDFEATKTTSGKSYDDAITAANDWLRGANEYGTKIEDIGNGRYGYKTPDGKTIDVTDAASRMFSTVKAAGEDVARLNSVETAAKRESGFDPDKIPASIKADAQKVYEQQKATLSEALSGWRAAGPGAQPSKQPKYTPAEIEKMSQSAKDNYLRSALQGNPAYDKYNEALQRRLNPADQSETMVMINDPKVKELWSSNLQGIATGLGLDKGLLTARVGSGKDAGTALTADQYDDIKGKLEVVGFDKDTDGKTVIKARAFKDVKGKKTDGEDIIIDIPQTNADSYLQKALSPETYYQFNTTGIIKHGLNNNTRTADFQVPDTKSHVNVRPAAQGQGWIITVPAELADGTPTELRVDSYNGIQQTIDDLSKKANTSQKK